MSTPKKSSESQGIDFNALVKAIKECLLEESGVRPTARAHGITKSTLSLYIKKVKDSFDDISSVQDDVLLEFVREKNQKIPTNMVCWLLLISLDFSRASLEFLD